MGVRIWWGVGGGQRMVWDRKRGGWRTRRRGQMEREGGSVCGGRNRGSRWREERRGNGLGEERPGQGEGQICVCLLRGEGEYK